MSTIVTGLNLHIKNRNAMEPHYVAAAPVLALVPVPTPARKLC
jgi:hypothetical protein